MRLRIRKTTQKDLHALMDLWNNGEVMNYVGFPNGLGMTEAKMDAWLNWINQTSQAMHYSIYENDKFVGETFYRADDASKPAIIDIKIYPSYQGKGIANQALSFCLDQLFLNTDAREAIVDPRKDNHKAMKLYLHLGFQVSMEIPYENQLRVEMLLDRDTWKKRRIDLVKLVDVTYDNFLEVIFLSVKEDQKNFIATNALSLAQSKYQEECIPKAIMVENNIVGFLMYCIERNEHEYWIFRLMIDQKYQGLGYGRKAMELIIHQIKQDPTHHLLRISFEPENIAAKTLYESFGFESTGVIDGGEIIYELKY